MRKTKLLLLATIALVSALMISTAHSKTHTGETEEVVVLTDSIRIKVSPQDSLKTELIFEAENYIFKKYPKTNKSIPTLLVEHGLKHEIDILFMMAQTQIETSFGTAGAGRETSRRSLFGVALKKYNNYESAIENYIKILKKGYLTKGRTEKHLMQRYTTAGGARYAENPNYEVELSGAYAEINRKTKIKELQEKYKNCGEEKLAILYQ